MKIKSGLTRVGLCLSVMLTLLSACSSQVQVKGDFPKPVVNQLPFTLGVHYPQNFSSYTYVESNEQREKVQIGMGAAQVSLFMTVLPAMFDNVVSVSDIGNVAPESGVDMILTMNVDDFQYTLPAETKVDMYEVWIKYNLRLFDPQGQLVADWILSAYGKSPNEMMKSDSELINDAMIVALRDAGASFTLSFHQVPEIRQYLQTKSNKHNQI